MPQDIARRETSSSQHSEDNNTAKLQSNDPTASRTTVSAARRRPHVTTACQQCRKAKAKCEGKGPCSRCIEKLYTCTFAPDEDNRNRVGMKRKIESLESDVSILNALLSVIRDNDEVSLTQMITIIRQGATISELRDFLHSVHSGPSRALDDTSSDAQDTLTTILTSIQPGDSMLSPSSAMPSPLTGPSSIVLPRRVFGVNRLTDIPLFSVSAAPWTSVTDDNDLISHLVSLYATWEHMFFDGVILEYFIRDMKAQDLASSFCSPFLVNCILATACTYSDFDEVRTSGCQVSALMGMFIRQAESLHDGYSMASLITTAQGLSILSTATKKQNDESTSRYYAQQALAACLNLLSARNGILNAAQSSQTKDELVCSIQSTLWGVLNVCGANLDGWLQSGDARLLFDAMGDPPNSWQPVRDVWKPYPVSSEATDSSYEQSRQYYARFSRLAYLVSQQTSRRWADSRHGLGESSASRQLADLSIQMSFWTDEVSIRLLAVEPAAPISAILLRWWAAYITTILLKAQAELEPKRFEHQMDPTTTTAGNKPESSQLNPKLNLISSALSIVGLCRSFKDMASDYSRIHPAMSVVFREALLVLAHADTNLQGSAVKCRQDCESNITELCDALKDMARRNPYTAVLARRTLLEIGDRNLRLPAAAASKLEQIEWPSSRPYRPSMPTIYTWKAT